jgi:hypothetical protein
MTDSLIYPVPGRSELRNRQIAGHEIGHALVTKCLGDSCWSVTIIPGDDFEGKCIRSGPPSDLTLQENYEDKTQEILTVCERLEQLTPEIGTPRSESGDIYIRSQNNIIALVAGEVAESLLHPDLPSLGSTHDGIEARAFARIAVAASPAVEALINYAAAEATALLTANRDMVDALVEALIEAGELSGTRVDEIISECVTARAVAAEKIRRIDWQARQRNATNFSKGLQHDEEKQHIEH